MTTRDELVEAAWSVLMPNRDRHHPDCPALTGDRCTCWAATIDGRISAVLDVWEPLIRRAERARIRDALTDLRDELNWHVGEYGDGYRTGMFVALSQVDPEVY